MHLWFKGSELQETVGFNDYLEACAFYDEQEADAEVAGATLIDQVGREIFGGPDDRSYQLTNCWDVTRLPGVFRWDESAEILRRVA